MFPHQNSLHEDGKAVAASESTLGQLTERPTPSKVRRDYFLVNRQGIKIVAITRAVNWPTNVICEIARKSLLFCCIVA